MSLMLFRFCSAFSWPPPPPPPPAGGEIFRQGRIPAAEDIGQVRRRTADPGGGIVFQAGRRRVHVDARRGQFGDNLREGVGGRNLAPIGELRSG